MRSHFAGGELPARVSVVGVGLMGSQIAQLFALNGIQTSIADVSEEAAKAGRERALRLASAYETQGLFEAGSAETVSSHLHAARSIGEAVAGAEFVLEAVTEDPDAKRAIYSQLGDAEPDAIVATNTSAIPIHELASSTPDPSRFLGTHWFNPPQWVPCVEVIAGPATDDEVIGTVVGLLEGLGKWPVRVGDAAGFVANRIQFAMFKEAVAVVEEGIATPAQVDAVVQGSFGYRLPFFGPFLIADMAGLDVYAGAYAALATQFGERFEAPSLLRALVDAGRLGIKQNGGFFDHKSTDPVTLVENRDRAFSELRRLVRRPVSADDRDSDATVDDASA